MFDHRNLATLGLFPGLVSHRSIANLGQLEIELIIQPARAGGGGGWRYPSDHQEGDDKYQVTIRVTTKKGKVWDYSVVVSEATASVVAKLAKIKLPQQPSVAVNSVTITPNAVPQVKVYKK